MLRPDGADLFICREFAALSLGEGFLERGCFLRTQLSRGLIFPGQLQEHAGKVILHFRGRARTVSTACSSNFVMVNMIDLCPAVRKDF